MCVLMQSRRQLFQQNLSVYTRYGTRQTWVCASSWFVILFDLQ